MTKLRRQSYLVCKQHTAAKAVVEMLVEQLLDFGWHSSPVVTVMYELFSKGSKTALLRRVSQAGATCYYEINGKVCGLDKYLKAQAKCQTVQAVLEDYGSVNETMFRKVGTAEAIVLIVCDDEIYATCTGTGDTHALLCEQFASQDGPQSVLYASFDAEGALYEASSDDIGSDIDYN